MFLLADLNGDKQKEAVAFYSATNAEGVDTIHVNLISKTEDGWKSVYDVETVGSAIDKVEVADISSTGTISLLVGVEAFSATAKQLNLFDDYRENAEEKGHDEAALEREKSLQQAMLTIKKKYGKNAILKGMNFEEGATARERNRQIGGHKA